MTRLIFSDVLLHAILMLPGIFFIRIDAANEVVYEVTAEPQEQPEQAQKEVHKDSAQGPVDPSSEQQPEGKPRCITPNLNLCNVPN